jgi:hypothetical protein
MQVALGIATSHEYRIDQVEGLYQTFLHRVAEAEGLSGATRFLESGGKTEDLKALILASPEYFQKAGNSNPGFLERLYRDTLGRSPDAVGAAGFGRVLAEGDFLGQQQASRLSVAGTVVHSVEAHTGLVQGYYQQFLHRAAEPAGLVGWVTQLELGEPDEAVLSGIVGSQEYFQRLPPPPPPPGAPPNAVIAWNQILLQAIQRDSSTPPVASRAMAMVQGAVLDAVNAIQGSPGRFVHLTARPGTSGDAAVAAAAHQVLGYLYPAQQATLDAALATSLKQIPDGQSKTDGISLGQAAGDAMIALRAHDGFDKYVNYSPGSKPGDWQPTAPMYDNALLPQWAVLQPSP